MLLVSGRGQDINTFPLWNGASYIWAWGPYSSETYGQTFTAAATQNDLLSMTFEIEAMNSSPYNFQAYVFQWTGTDTTGGPLFTSVATAAPTGTSVFVPVTINTGGLNLTPGQQYVAFFSVNGLNNGPNGEARWGYLGTASSSGADGYSGGNFVFNDNTSTTFAGGWLNPSFYGDAAANDLAFQLAFAPVPEPSTISLACLGVLALSSRLRRPVL